MYRYTYLFVETVTLLTCIFCYRKFWVPRFKLFLPYMVFIVWYEFTSITRSFFMHKWFYINHSNLWIVNFEVTLEFLFYSFFVISSYRDKKDRRMYTFISLLFTLFTFIDIFFIQGFLKLCSIAIVLQYALLILMVCRFFYKTMQQFDKDTTLIKQPDFWVNTGLLFFCLAEFLFFASFNLAYVRHIFFSTIFHLVSGLANIILYSCIAISFICYRRTRTISSSS